MQKVFEIEFEDGNIYDKNVNDLANKYGINLPFLATDGILIGVAIVKEPENMSYLEFYPFNQMQIREIDCNQKPQVQHQGIDSDTLLKAIALAQKPDLIKDI